MLGFQLSLKTRLFLKPNSTVNISRSLSWYFPLLVLSEILFQIADVVDLSYTTAENCNKFV